MTRTLIIGELAKRTGVSAKTIRFYEAEGLIPPPTRSDAGYRLYGPTDLRRLRLIRRARLLGLSLPEVRLLVEQAFASDCAGFTAQLCEHIERQRSVIDGRIAELTALRAELDGLEEHVRHARARMPAGGRVADCGFCPLIDDEEETVS